MSYNTKYSILISGILWLVALRTLAQPTQVKPLERLQARADLFFREGAYQKAINLYAACQNFPFQTDKALLTAKIQKAQTIIRLDNLALSEIRKGNKAKALALTEQIILANPNDPYARASRKDLLASQGYTLTTQDARLHKRADDFISKGDWTSASTILRLIDAMPTGKKDPQIARKLHMVRDMLATDNAVATALKNKDYNQAVRIAETARTVYPEAQNSTVINSIPKVDKQAIRLRNEVLEKASKYVSQCEWERAIVEIINARKQPELTEDQRLKARLNGIRALQRNLYTISVWKSDPSKRAATLLIYEQVFKAYPNCIRESYYNYVVEEGQNKQSNENYAGAILAYIKAKRIYPAFALKDKTNQRIVLCDSLSKCPDKTRVFTALMTMANQQFRACDCETAVETWRSAEKYVATICSSGEANRIKWEEWKKQVTACEQDKLEAKRFGALMTEAVHAFEADNCQEAKRLYQIADSLHTRCGVLNKRSLDSAIVACDKCLRIQCFDSTYAQGELSLSKNFKREALVYYRRALACPAPDDRKDQLIGKIDKLSCEIENKGCPPVEPPSTKSRLFSLHLAASGGILKPTLNNGTEDLPVQPGPYLALGLNADYTPKDGPISVRVGVQITQYSINSIFSGTVLDKQFTLNALRVPIGIRLHTAGLKPGRMRMYLFGEYALAKPLRFNYTNERLKANENNLAYAASTFSTVSGGIGIEQNNKKFGFFLEVGYQMFLTNVFSTKTLIYNNYYTSDYTNIYGVTLGIRIQ